ncbi:MAG: hypothetical protein JSW41_00405 [Candidatus Aenigmatarchaeota archaeon]|nr:MAG: hypothetical protein JSW41_00405 [Candidatus Aenigmarchaeota archaeon]
MLETLGLLGTFLVFLIAGVFLLLIARNAISGPFRTIMLIIGIGVLLWGFIGYGLPAFGVL